jgi:hypothetical protein
VLTVLACNMYDDDWALRMIALLDWDGGDLPDILLHMLCDDNTQSATTSQPCANDVQAASANNAQSATSQQCANDVQAASTSQCANTSFGDQELDGEELNRREREIQLLLQRLREDKKNEKAERERECEEEERERKRKRRAKETLLANAWEDEKRQCRGLPIFFVGDGSWDDEAVLKELNFIAGSHYRSHYVGGTMNVSRRFLDPEFGHSQKWPEMAVLAVRLGNEGPALETLAINFALDNIVGCANKARDARGLSKEKDTINFVYVCYGEDASAL